jgi:hypothetical protein
MKFVTKLAMFALLALAAQAKADRPSIHGMVLFGEKATYLSHLPMFHSPHDYQVLLKVNLKEPSKVVEIYKALKADGSQVFTIAPEPFDLTTIISGKVNQFSAQLYHGHFEKEGKELGKILVQVEKVLFSSKLDPAAEEENSYFLFGAAGEYFAAHVINGKPSFDSILKVSAPFELEFNFCRTRVCADPKNLPVPDSALPIVVSGPFGLNGDNKPKVGSQIGNFGGIMTTVLQVIYFEEEELSH